MNSSYPISLESPWSSGIFYCFSDCSTCCLTFWCPCITFGQIAEILDKGNPSCCVNGALYCVVSSLTGCACCYSCCYRSKLRQQFMLKKSPCDDCLVHFFCELCPLYQARHELKSRGFDMSSGWKENVEKQNLGVSMASKAPMVEGGMKK